MTLWQRRHFALWAGGPSAPILRALVVPAAIHSVELIEAVVIAEVTETPGPGYGE
jgi:hypothetical protein